MPRARITKRDAALVRAFKVAQREKQGREKYPDPPHMLDGQPTDAGLKLVTMTAERGCVQGKIAALLGIGAKQFQKLLGPASSDTPPPIRLAFEAGFAEHKSALIEYLTQRALEGDTNAGMFLLRSVHELRDGGPIVSLDQSDRRINITLPGSFPTVESYMASIGQEKIIEARDPKKIAEYERDLKLLPAPDQVAPLPAPEPTLSPTDAATKHADDMARVQARTHDENLKLAQGGF